MAPAVSVQKLRKGLYRILWNTGSGICRNSSFNIDYTDVDLSEFGVEEYYSMEYRVNKKSTEKLLLSVSLFAYDERKNCKERKITARFLGYEKNMILTSYPTSKSEEDVPYEWEAKWIEIPLTSVAGCANCMSSLGVAETFEILIDMDPLSTLEQGQQNVLTYLSHLWESKTLADVTFRCEDKDIEAHTLIISSGSPVLAAMFQNEFKEKQERIAIIRETRADVFEKLLYFIYTGDFDFGFHDIAALLVAADMYDVDALKKQCEKHLSKNVTLTEATNYLILSHLHNAEDLLVATMIYMQKNSEKICTKSEWLSVITNYPELGFIATQFMIKKSMSVNSLLKEMRQLGKPNGSRLKSETVSK